ncbi:hypothetical protein KSP40_PGU018367 [Platanthera guangdongensis]|uniref:Uncharacterized protein n=1 Tax=Platanthera guangdongensis TaxID=2320717 RepID=A0ABR2M8K8_9ASPA
MARKKKIIDVIIIMSGKGSMILFIIATSTAQEKDIPSVQMQQEKSIILGADTQGMALQNLPLLAAATPVAWNKNDEASLAITGIALEFRRMRVPKNICIGLISSRLQPPILQVIALLFTGLSADFTDHNRAATFPPGSRILLARDFAMDASTFISLSVRSPTFYHRPPPLRGGHGLLCRGFHPRRRQTSLFANPSSPHLFLRTHVRCFSRSPEKYINADSVGVEPPHTGTLTGSRGEVISLLTPEEELTVSKTVRYRNRFLNFLRLGSVVDNMADSFFKSEIRRRLFATALLIVISRVGNFIPLPGFDRRLMPQDNLCFASGSTDELGDFSAELKLSLFQLGISPQIAASIVMQVPVFLLFISISNSRLTEMQFNMADISTNLIAGLNRTTLTNLMAKGTGVASESSVGLTAVPILHPLAETAHEEK